MSIIKEKKLLDEVRDVMRLNHYSIHTERSYCDLIKRYVRFHGMSSRNDLKDGEKTTMKGTKNLIEFMEGKLLKSFELHILKQLLKWNLA